MLRSFPSWSAFSTILTLPPMRKYRCTRRGFLFCWCILNNRDKELLKSMQLNGEAKSYLLVMVARYLKTLIVINFLYIHAVLVLHRNRGSLHTAFDPKIPMCAWNVLLPVCGSWRKGPDFCRFPLPAIAPHAISHASMEGTSNLRSNLSRSILTSPLLYKILERWI